MAKETALTQEYVKSILDYNPDTGVFTWKRRVDRDNSWNSKYAGKETSWKHSSGYRQTCINRKKLYLHRVAWLYINGVWPSEIDHIDCDKTNNRISNLREVSHRDNCYNRKGKCSNTYSKYKGISKDKRDGAWLSSITKDGKTVSLGRFKCETSAYLAYCKAAKELHGEFARFS